MVYVHDISTLRLTLQTYLGRYVREVYSTYDEFSGLIHLKDRDGRTILTLRGPMVGQTYDEYLIDLLRAATDWKVSMDIWHGELGVCL